MGNTMTFSPYSGGQYKNGIDTLGYYKNEVYERYIQVHIDEGSLRCRDDFDSLPCYNHLGTVTSLSYYIRQCRDWGCTPADFRTYFSRRNNGTGELDFIEYTNITENRIVGKDGDNWSCIGQDLRSYGSDAILIPK